MQGFSYSVFSLVAIAIHLIINFDLFGRKSDAMRGTRYRGFLMGVLAYYITDGAWGIIAGLELTRPLVKTDAVWRVFTNPLYVDTIFFFLSLVAFVFMWSRFVVTYLEFGKRAERTLAWFGYALWAFNFAALALNPFNKCFFYLDSEGVYQFGCVRDPAFYLLVVYTLLIAVFVFAAAIQRRGIARRRCTMVLLCCITMGAALALQIIWKLAPFTSLGCLLCCCFFHVFVIQDEQTAKHMAELEDALERARVAEKARSMFFSIVSHDIRTPLNAILGYSEFLQFGVKTQEERDEALQSIRASGTTLLQLVNDVLDLAKMDSEEMTLHPTPMRLDQLTDEVFASFRLVADGKGLELVNRTADVPTILLDEHRFRQILFNLVGNAVKFTEHGSVTVAASYAGTNLEVTVTDTGRGIAPDMLTRVLDPFVQVQDPSHAADRTGGTGLGLSICKRLVEVMGGEIIVESELGKGSTFRLRIPNVATCEAKPGANAASKPVVSSETLPKHVLVVDDSPVNRKVLTAFLKKAGVVSIGQAGDGEKALAELDAAMNAGDPYDFVLSDLWMPNMNGLEFIEKFHADPRFAGVPVFAVTADTEFRRDARIELFTGVLLKPLTYGKLMEVFAAESQVG